MTHTFRLPRRAARFRAPILLTLTALAFGACNSDRLSPPDPSTDTPISATDPALADSAAAEARLEDSLATQDALADPSGGQPIADEDDGAGDVEDTDVQVEVVDPAALSASSAEGLSMSAYRGGIPFGVFHLPTSLYGRGFSGSLANTSSATRALVPLLAAARRNGVKVVISLVGSDHYYKNSNGTFSLPKWKARVGKYTGSTSRPTSKTAPSSATTSWTSPTIRRTGRAADVPGDRGRDGQLQQVDLALDADHRSRLAGISQGLPVPLSGCGLGPILGPVRLHLRFANNNVSDAKGSRPQALVVGLEPAPGGGDRSGGQG